MNARVILEKEDFDIEVSLFSKEHMWISLQDKFGNTAKRPYGIMTLEEIKTLKNALGIIIKQIERGEIEDGK